MDIGVPRMSTPASQVQSENAEMLDAYYHKLLKQGGIRVHVIRDNGTSSVELVDFPAAMCNAINNRLKALRLQSPAGIGTSAGALVEEAARRGLRYEGKDVLPPLDTDADDVATGAG